MSDTETPPAGARHPEDPLLSAQWYRNYVLTLLVLGYVINFIDRTVLGILLEPIRQEFGASDTALGLLVGLPFALFYATLGVPIAALADRTSRRNILALAMLLWSGMTALCGLAVNFVMLFLARIGTAVGEAGGSPPSHALIADYFPQKQRATALSVYGAGVTIGGMLANLAGGWSAEFFGWRMTFILVGLPGVILALIIRFTVKEPPRGYSDETAASPGSDKAPSMGRVFSLLWQRTSFRHLSVGAALTGLFGQSMLNFAPPYLIRSHDLSTGEAGTIMGVVAGVGMLGTVLGGILADRLSTAKDDRRWYMWTVGMAALLAIPCGIIAYLSPGLLPASVFLVLLSVFGTVWIGPVFAMTQGLVPVTMRAVAAAILLLVVNLIGQALGPSLTGLFSDLLTPVSGEASLRHSLTLVVTVFGAWSALHFFLGAKRIRQDIAETEKLVSTGEA